MGKTLRVCLSMGGGVSLGSFSGAALTEALKLLVLYGKDKDGQPYDSVIVDGMSGASAGAIALTIILKCLIDYTVMLPLYDENYTEKDLLDEIARDYFNEDRKMASAHKNIEALKALQLAQKIQYKIWVEEVDAKKLYGKKVAKEYQSDPSASFALLDRQLLEDLTKKYLMSVAGMDIANRQLLDPKRVVFACSLTNLLPIEMSVPKRKKNNKLNRNVNKSVGSHNHSELRVIDFVFKKDAAIVTDPRWLRFCEQPDTNNPTHFNIKKQSAWATIAASALACGAFPIAFEPVLLKRYQNEFGLEREISAWPTSFKEMQEAVKDSRKKHPNTFKENSYFGENGDNYLDYKSFNFPYIDGGTFNNEPIREAYKIGAFQDFARNLDNEERIILFVDPIVQKDEHKSFKVTSFSPVKRVQNANVFRNEWDKLFGNVSNIMTVLTNQGSIKEEDAVSDVKENFALRNTIFNYLNANTTMHHNLTLEIINTAFNKVQENLKSSIISLGTRDTVTYFIEEIRKSCLQQGILDTVCLELQPSILYQLKQQIDEATITNISEAYHLMGLHEVKDQNAFAQAVFKVITDFALDIEGKYTYNHRIAILPVNANLDTIGLPGGEIQAFGGFASLNARKYAFEFAKLSTLLSLKAEDGFRGGQPIISDQSLQSLYYRISGAIKALNFYQANSTYPRDLEHNLFVPTIDRIKGLLVTNTWLRFLLFKSPFAATFLFGTAAMPVLSVVSLGRTLFKKSSWKGSGILKKYSKYFADQINYIALEPVTISILSDYKLKGKLLIGCSNAAIRKRKALQHKRVMDHDRVRYQYFFQVSLVEYIKEKESIIHPDDVSSTSESLKVQAAFVQHIGLSLLQKVAIPKHIDGNLEPKQKRLAIQANYKDIIEEIRIDSYNLPLVSLAINDPASTLHHSIKNINYHVNPLLEIDLQKIKNGWYFNEQTESLDKKILRSYPS